MVDVRGVISSLFVMLKENIYVLIRIELLVAVVTAIFLAMFIMDFYQCRTHSSVLTTILKRIDGVSDQIVVYIIGAMQSAKFENELFPVWAVVLVSLRTSLGYLSGYGIVDRERRYIEVANVIKFIGAGVLTGTRGLKYVKPLWSLWAILVLRSVCRYLAHDRAIRSLWHGRSSEFIPEYMRTIVSVDDEKNTAADGGNTSATKPAEDKYIVYGESNQKITFKKPQYTMKIDSRDDGSPLVTLRRIRECDWRHLMNRNSQHEDSVYEDLSMAFSLSRLLRCRLEDVMLNKDSIADMQDLIVAEFIPDAAAAGRRGQPQAERVFRILELELAFVKDYFCTLYPMVFSDELRSLFLCLLLSMATFSIALWLAVGIRKVYQPPEGNLVLWVGGCNFDIIMTWVFMSFMMIKEIWEIVTYLVSNWTRLLFACKYVQNQAWFLGERVMKCTVRSLFRSKIAEPWHGQIDQYDFLQQSTYKATFWNVASVITLGKIKGKLEGKRAGEAIKIPQCVKPAILQAIRRIGLTSRPMLPGDIPSLMRSRTIQPEQYEWACHKLRTCSQVILVWHIATSLCEIKLAHDKNIDLTKPGFMRSAWLYMKKKLSCGTPDPYLVGQKSNLSDGLKTNYHIAISLSKYCAYLQIFLPELLPDSFLVPEVIFIQTLKHAREQLDDCNLIWCRYIKLTAIAQQVAPGSVDENLKLNILQQGAILGKELISINDDEARWKILAEFWADLLVHIAPSWNAADHKNNLESGGEFITLIWALLWHCGIEKSNLWHKDEEFEISTQEHQENSTETRDRDILSMDGLMPANGYGIESYNEELEIIDLGGEGSTEMAYLSAASGINATNTMVSV